MQCISGTCTGTFTSCHTEIEVADQTFYLTQSQYTDTGPTSPSWPYSARRLAGWPLKCQFLSHWYDSTGKIPSQAGFEPWILRSRGGRLNHWINEAVWVQTGWRLYRCGGYPVNLRYVPNSLNVRDRYPCPRPLQWNKDVRQDVPTNLPTLHSTAALLFNIVVVVGCWQSSHWSTNS